MYTNCAQPANLLAVFITKKLDWGHFVLAIHYQRWKTFKSKLAQKIEKSFKNWNKNTVQQNETWSIYAVEQYICSVYVNVWSDVGRDEKPVAT